MRRTQPERIIGRYALFCEIASGGMASVHLGRLLGPVGFSRVVAIKRLHPHLARDPEFVAMFIDEARLAARVQHPNVVPTLDVVALDGELFIVMEYIQGESLARLVRLAKTKAQRIPIDVINAVIIGTLHGLHAAHEARGEGGRALRLVHRDVSPQNILVGSDGLVRVVDFGIAMAAGRSQRTASGVLKGKLRYMAPEQVMLEPVDRRTDVYAASVVLWEMLAGRPLFSSESEWQIAEQIRSGETPRPSKYNPEVSAALDEIVLRGCAVKPDDRFPTAGDMAEALIAAAPCAIGRTVGKLVEALAAESLAQRRKLVERAESQPSGVQDLAVLGQESVAESGDAATLARPVPDEDDEATTTRADELVEADPTAAEAGKTRPGGAFAGTRRVRASGEAPGTPPPEDASSRTEATWAAGTQRRLSPSVLGVLAGTAVALAIGLVLLLVHSSTSTENAQAAASASAPSTASATVAATGGQLDTAPPPPVDADGGRHADEKPSVAPGKDPARPMAPGSGPEKRAPATSRGCTPPYYVDAHGDKHFRRECL